LRGRRRLSRLCQAAEAALRIVMVHSEAAIRDYAQQQRAVSRRVGTTNNVECSVWFSFMLNWLDFC
ncbi:MAG: hypothetical protein WBQ37_03480, partial [Candidatus Competibacter sp.]